MNSFLSLRRRGLLAVALVLTVLTLFVLPARPVAAASIVVNSAADTVANDGACTLREAIINANADNQSGSTDCAAGSGADTITFAADYTITLIGSQLPAITSAMTITGNGAANTIIRAQLCDTTPQIENCYRVFEIAAGNLTLDGVTVRNGICINSCSSVGNVGGGILNNGTLTVSNSSVIGNFAGFGGGIYNFGGRVTVTNSDISSNAATSEWSVDGSGGEGGGIYNTLGTLIVTSSTIASNTALRVSDPLVFGRGGGIYNAGTTATVSNSVLIDNRAWFGGAIYNASNSMTITNSTLTVNIARNHGGGVLNDGGALTVTNSTLSGNNALIGGGIWSEGTLTVTNSTLSRNLADTGGGGILHEDGTLTVTNSILSGNRADVGDEIFRFSGLITANAYNVFGHSGQTNASAFAGFTPGASDITATSDGTNPTALAAILNTTLANNGGPTQTHALVPGSPAIDLAPSADCEAGTAVDGLDQRGLLRNVDGNGAASANECDAGAYEYQPSTGTIIINKNAVPDGTTPFTFSQNMDQSGNFVLADPATPSKTFANVPAGGPYTVTETRVPGWVLAVLSCSVPSSGTSSFTGDLANATVTITLGANETVTCTFTNTQCQPGTFDNGGNACVPAPAGSFVPTPGATEATECSAGTWQDQTGQTSCKLADPGFFVPVPGATQQTQCPAGTTSEAGAIACTAVPLATLTIAKVTDPAGGQDFPFTVDLGANRFAFKWGEAGVGGGQFNKPRGVAIDAAGNVYIGDSFNHRVQKFDSSGVFQFAFGWDVVVGGGTGFEICLPSDTCKAGVSGSGNGQFDGPNGIAVDTAGNIYVVDSGNHRLQKFTSSGAYDSQWGGAGGAAGQFNAPVGLALDTAGNVYVADRQNQRIQKFDSNGLFQFALGWDVVVGGGTGFEICTPADTCKPGVGGGGNGQLLAPTGIAVDAAGNIYVSEPLNNRIHKFDSSGAFQFAFGRDVVVGGGTGFELCTPADTCKGGTVGAGDGELDFPNAVAVDAAGNVYVADSGNRRIQTFDGAGTYLTQWGSAGSGDGQFDFPDGLAVNAAGVVYVADTNLHRIQAFNPDLTTTLGDGESESFDLAPGDYTVRELVPAGWELTNIECDTENYGGFTPGDTSAALSLDDGDDVTCTFTNTQLVVSACPVDAPNVGQGTVGSQLTTLYGTGMGSPTRSRMVAKVTIPYANDIVDLYGQMAGKEQNGVKYVRFIFGDKSYEQVQPETDLGAKGAISWWGEDLTAEFQAQARPYVKGRWFLEKGTKKLRIPRAIVFYATHTNPTDYANSWTTFGAPTNFVAHTPGFDQSNSNLLPIPETQATTDITVQLAITDVNRDARTVDVIVTAGNVSETVTLTGPTNKKSELLNLFEVTLEDVPAGVDEVEIELVSVLDTGDSAALLGAAASYACEPEAP